MRGPLPLFLRVVGVFDLQPPDACVVGIRETLRYDTFEVVCAHQLEEFAAPALDEERLGNDRRPLRNNTLEVLKKAASAMRCPLQIGRLFYRPSTVALTTLLVGYLAELR